MNLRELISEIKRRSAEDTMTEAERAMVVSWVRNEIAPQRHRALHHKTEALMTDRDMAEAKKPEIKHEEFYVIAKEDPSVVQGMTIGWGRPRHRDADTATEDAIRTAERHGGKFYILKAVRVVEAKAKVSATEKP